MKFLKNIFLFVLGEIGCTKEDFIHAANQESKWKSYLSVFAMIMYLSMMLFMVCCTIVMGIVILILIGMSIIECPIILVGITILVCLPYIVMLFLNYIIKKEKENENKNRFCK